jgi:hypothetical protein
VELIGAFCLWAIAMLSAVASATASGMLVALFFLIAAGVIAYCIAAINQGRKGNTQYFRMALLSVLLAIVSLAHQAWGMAGGPQLLLLLLIIILSIFASVIAWAWNSKSTKRLRDKGTKKMFRIAEKMRREAWFAHINWQAHAVTMFEECFDTFQKELADGGVATSMYWSSLRRDYERGHHRDVEREVWVDSICLSFGGRVLPGCPVVPVKGRLSALAEAGSVLVLSQTYSGHVLAIIYPPWSEVCSSERSFYMVDAWSDPRHITRRKLTKLFQMALEADTYCSAGISPSRRSGRILASFRAKDEVLRNGGSRIWNWLKYVLAATRGTLRLYGIGKPIPL